MRMKGFIGTALSLMVSLSAPALAQEPIPPTGDSKPGGGQPPEPPKESPPPSDAPASNDAAGSNAPPVTPEPPPATSPGDTATGAPAVGEPPPPGTASPPSAEPSAEPDADTGKKTVIGERLSPLVATVSFGYGYASIKYPNLLNTNVDGLFIELAGGTELSRQFRLLLAFTSLETSIRRVSLEQWEEGKYQAKVAGLHATAGPTTPFVSPSGGVDMQRTMHAHSLGPRLDFLPLGVQGPYIGVTTALAITTGIETRVGASLGARVGGEWRPFQEFSVGIEAGAQGQVYSDGNAAIPYAALRLNVLLDPAGLTSKGKGSVPGAPMTPRTLPAPMPR